MTKAIELDHGAYSLDHVLAMAALVSAGAAQPLHHKTAIRLALKALQDLSQDGWETEVSATPTGRGANGQRQVEVRTETLTLGKDMLLVVTPRLETLWR